MLNINYSGNGINYDISIVENRINARYNFPTLNMEFGLAMKLQPLVDSGQLKRLESETVEKNLTVIFYNCKKEAAKYKSKRAEEAKKINLIKTRF